ncbi:MAG: ROK family protein, partial [Clostridia bacterium]|nr:ROK family protein [Clostridia bacterium]
ERDGGQISRYETKIHGTDEMYEADLLYIERTIKMMLWAAGGYKIYVCGCDKIGQEIAKIYSAEGERSFDFGFMERVYEKPFQVICLPYAEAPAEVSNPKSIGGNNTGCRIGFDAGGSDRKVYAVVDGECVYSEEVLWLPKVTADPDYHYNEILTAFKTAASKMPRVDAIGVSSAGIYVDNRAMVASLFISVPDDLFDKKVKDIYIRAAKEVAPDAPLNVINDGDVSALAGAITLGENNVLGIAMGTSEAVGYVNSEGNVTGWLNELAFAPVDIGGDKPQDDWSGDFGVGCKYFSQDAVIRLAPKAGIELDESLTLAKKLKAVQEIMDGGDERAIPIYETIGCYFAHTIAYYAKFYDVKHILLLGRVMSGEGGDVLLKVAQKVLAEEYPQLTGKVEINLPDEKFRRLGQSVVAASL